MRVLHIPGKRAGLAAAGVVVALGAGGTAYAATTSGSGSSTTTAPAATPSGARHARSLLARTDHATVEVKVKGQWVTYTLDRGKVTAAGPTSITLARPDGQTVTDTVNSGTRFTGVDSAAAVQLNRPATVLSDGGVALRVHQAAGAAKPGSGSS